MGFSDIFKNSFLKNYSQIEISEVTVLTAFFVAALLGMYIFFFYRWRTRNIFYSKEFAISLVAVTIITTAVIVTIQQSIVVSLGMVGALSIVRFRTAVKNPMDLAFMFWAIVTGIICGACMSVVAILLAIVMTIVILFLELVPNSKPSKIVQISYINDKNIEKMIVKMIRECSSNAKEKSRNTTNEQIDVIYEIRIKDGKELTYKLSEIEGVYGCNLVNYEGDR